MPAIPFQRYLPKSFLGDTYDKIDPEVLVCTFAFTSAFIRALDKRV